MTVYCRCGHSVKRHQPKCLTCDCKGEQIRADRSASARKPKERSTRHTSLRSSSKGERALQPLADPKPSALTQKDRDAILRRINKSGSAT